MRCTPSLHGDIATGILGTATAVFIPVKRITQALFLLAALPAGAATLYTGDGVLSNRQETLRWYVNRARYAPEREADRLGLNNTAPGGHPDYDVCEDPLGPNDFGTTTNAWLPWTRSLPPVAPNVLLIATSQKHSQDMAATLDFKHNSPSSNYYPTNSNPGQRLTLEGYAWSAYAENIGAGYSTPVALHDALFVDTSISNRGHRMNILSPLVREIGMGFAFTNASYQRYETQDFGRRSTNHFFSDTIYYDANANGLYDQGEGVGNVEIHLWNGLSEALWYDASQPSGSFAIPINDLPDGSNVWIELRNAGATTNITIPFGYTFAGDTTLTNNESFWLGTFRQPFGITNVGFRNISPMSEEASLAVASDTVLFSFSGFRRATYRLEYADTLDGSWTNWLTTTATADVTTVSAPNAAVMRFYRASLLKD